MEILEKLKKGINPRIILQEMSSDMEWLKRKEHQLSEESFSSKEYAEFVEGCLKRYEEFGNEISLYSSLYEQRNWNKYCNNSIFRWNAFLEEAQKEIYGTTKHSI